eukprot:GSChrysophyteH1.ASY1.ANO1.1106.1 assembled CDS
MARDTIDATANTQPEDADEEKVPEINTSNAEQVHEVDDGNQIQKGKDEVETAFSAPTNNTSVAPPDVFKANALRDALLEAEQKLSPEQRTWNAHLNTIVHATRANSELLSSVTFFRKQLSSETDAERHIDEVIRTGLIEKFIKILLLNGEVTKADADSADVNNINTAIQFQTAWLLSNVASGTHKQTQEIINGGALPAFIALLSDASTPLKVVGQIVWAFGNISGDSVGDRDQLLAQGAVAALTKATSLPSFFSEDKEITQTAAWAISNLCRGKPPPLRETVSGLIPILHKLLLCDDHETIVDACYGFSYLCQEGDQSVASILSYGVENRLVALFQAVLDQITVPLLRTLGNVISAEDSSLVDKVVNLGVARPLGILAFGLPKKKHSIRKEATWTLSNITAGSKEQIQNVLDSGVFNADLIKLLESNEENSFSLQKETAYIIENISSSGTVEQMKMVYEAGILPPLCQLLDPVKHPEIETTKAHEVISIALKAIAAFLRMAKASDDVQKAVIDTVEQSGKAFITRIAHDNSNSDSNSVFAQSMLDSYFDH